MAALEVDVSDVKRLAVDLEHAADTLPDLVDAALADFAGEWQSTAVRAAPRRTGRLAGSHSVTVTAGMASVIADAPYAAAVHKRDPWLARALDSTQSTAERLLEDALERATNI